MLTHASVCAYVVCMQVNTRQILHGPEASQLLKVPLRQSRHCTILPARKNKLTFFSEIKPSHPFISLFLSFLFRRSLFFEPTWPDVSFSLSFSFNSPQRKACMNTFKELNGCCWNNDDNANRYLLSRRNSTRGSPARDQNKNESRMRAFTKYNSSLSSLNHSS